MSKEKKSPSNQQTVYSKPGEKKLKSCNWRKEKKIFEKYGSAWKEYVAYEFCCWYSMKWQNIYGKITQRIVHSISPHLLRHDESCILQICCNIQLETKKKLPLTRSVRLYLNELKTKTGMKSCPVARGRQKKRQKYDSHQCQECSYDLCLVSDYCVSFESEFIQFRSTQHKKHFFGVLVPVRTRLRLISACNSRIPPNKYSFD